MSCVLMEMEYTGPSLWNERNRKLVRRVLYVSFRILL